MVHFLVQSVPKLSLTKIIRTIKSITAKEIFARYPEVSFGQMGTMCQQWASMGMRT